MARAVELILARVPRHAATEVRALAIGRDDPARRVDEEELSLEVEDRRVVRRLEVVEDALLGPHRDLRAEAEDLVHPDERHDEDGDLRDREERAAEKSETQQLAPLDPADEPLDGRVGVRPNHVLGSKHWWVAGTAHGAKRSMPGPRNDVPTIVRTRYTDMNPVNTAMFHSRVFAP